MKVRRALISVSDKTGIEDFASGLNGLGIDIIASSGTRAALSAADIPSIATSAVTDFPDTFLGGRVKTLQARIHAAILADRRDNRHMSELESYNIKPIDLVCVNLYPFSDQADEFSYLREAVNQIDIGGPMMLRTASLNYRYVIVVARPADYIDVLTTLREYEGDIPERMREKLAARAIAQVAHYESKVSLWFADRFERDRAELESSSDEPRGQV